MISRRVSIFFRKVAISQRYFHKSAAQGKEFENPLHRTWKILTNWKLNKDVTGVKPDPHVFLQPLERPLPSHADIVIIGGGAVGSSIAYWLQERTGPNTLSVVVIEKDLTYKQCSTTLSVGGLRQQFSLPENIQMSLFGAEFLRTIKRRFGAEADVFFTPHGYLVLASEEGAQQLIDNSKLQKELGAVNEVLSKDALKERFPWMNVDDVACGCLGLEKEGWFDPWALLTLLKSNAEARGTQYVKGTAVDFLSEKQTDIIVQGSEDYYENLKEVVVKLPSGEHKSIRFAYCVIAAGSESGEVAKLAKIGCGPGLLSIPLPVEKRKRYVYCFDCQGIPPGINTPLVIDHNHTYFRRDGLGGRFIGGLSPNPEEEPPVDDLEVDHKFFEDRVWPNLANRVPAFNSIKVQSAWSGYYDMNLYDENGIIGNHPYYYNLFMATGFSGHGIQQAPAVGRAVAELILDGKYKTIDLTRLGFDRLITDKPMLEIGIY